MSMPFAAFALRTWYAETGWAEDNAYSSLLRSSNALLDFAVQPGFRIDTGHSPTRFLSNRATLEAMGEGRFLSGSLAYFYARPDLSLESSHHPLALQHAAERFLVPPVPQRPEPLLEIWQRGERVDEAPQLMYGRLFIPSGRLDALWAIRLSQAWQTQLRFLSIPAQPLARSNPPSLASSTGDLQASLAAIPPQQSLIVSLTRDWAPWNIETSYQFDDGLLGVGALYNFARPQSALAIDAGGEADQEDHFIGSGLRGRFSVGGEAFMNLQGVASGGVSIGGRFCTVPDTRGPQPPTVITAAFAPFMGQVSTAYAAKVGRDLALCSRFNFNVYSYDSEVTLGAEWFQRAQPAPVRKEAAPDKSGMTSTFWQALATGEEEGVIGLVKLRASTTSDVRFVWERKIRNCIAGFSLSTQPSAQHPVKAVGLSLSYWS